MRAFLFALLVVLATTGATCRVKPTPQVPVADAPAECRRAHFPSGEDTGIRWTSNPEDPEAFDEVTGVVLPTLAGRALATERSRQACVGFIDDLHKRRVIRKE